VRDAFGLTTGEVENLCLAAVDAAWLDPSDKRIMRSEFAAEMAALR
jgi:hypothetical protein